MTTAEVEAVLGLVPGAEVWHQPVNAVVRCEAVGDSERRVYVMGAFYDVDGVTLSRDLVMRTAAGVMGMLTVCERYDRGRV